MSMMKPVDNHTTSMGRMVIIGSRTLGLRGMTALNSLVLRAPVMVHSFLRAVDKRSPQEGPAVVPRAGSQPGRKKPGDSEEIRRSGQDLAWNHPIRRETTSALAPELDPVNAPRPSQARRFNERAGLLRRRAQSLVRSEMPP
jgi:hypothetical protein